MNVGMYKLYCTLPRARGLECSPTRFATLFNGLFHRGSSERERGKEKKEVILASMTGAMKRSILLSSFLLEPFSSCASFLPQRSQRGSLYCLGILCEEQKKCVRGGFFQFPGEGRNWVLNSTLYRSAGLMLCQHKAVPLKEEGEKRGNRPSSETNIAFYYFGQ